MSSLGLFITGVVISIPAGGGLLVLLRAAVADGRENARVQAEIARRRDRTSREPVQQGS